MFTFSIGNGVFLKPAGLPSCCPGSDRAPKQIMSEDEREKNLLFPPYTKFS